MIGDWSISRCGSRWRGSKSLPVAFWPAARVKRPRAGHDEERGRSQRVVVDVLLVVELLATGGGMVCVVRVLVELSATPFSFR